MQGSETPTILAHATIPTPRGMAHLGVARVDVILKPTQEGRYRWFHSDGSATVVDGASVEEACRVAQLVWSEVHLHQTTAQT